MKQILFCLILGVAVLSAGCSFKNDRCWVDKYRYREAREIYEETLTLSLVREHLENEPEWRPCEINEVIYRLKKEYHLEDVPDSM